MRILHVVHQYLPEKVGGTELYTRALAQRQAQRGHEVTIFTASATAESSDEDGVRVIRVPLGARSATAVFRDNFRQPHLLAAFTDALQATRPQIVHVQHLMGLPLGVARRLRAARVPYVVTLHDYWHVCANAQLLTNYDSTVCAGPQAWLNCARCALARAGHPNALPLVPALAPLFGYRALRLRRMLHRACALIAPTAFTRDVHVQLGVAPDKIHIVPHGIELPPDLPARAAVPGTVRVAYVGGIAWQKGVHVLLAAFNELPRAMRLTIYGDTSAFPAYTAELERLVRHPNVHFAGRLPHTELWGALAETDVVVVPSLWYETASLIVQEAFAAGAPVVASALGALEERVHEGVDGRLFPAGDALALREILLGFWQEPEQLAALRAGIRPVRTMAEHIDDIEEIYHSCTFAL